MSGGGERIRKAKRGVGNRLQQRGVREVGIDPLKRNFVKDGRGVIVEKDRHRFKIA